MAVTTAETKIGRLRRALLLLTLCLLSLLAVVPLVNLVVRGLADLKVDWAAGLTLEQLGQMGDFFGGHTAAVSGLLSVALILYFSTLQNKRTDEQLALSRRSADLQSLVNIYEHYGSSYGEDRDANKILRSIAEGHRGWVIRESFSLIDPDQALEAHRNADVLAKWEELLKLFQRPAAEWGDRWYQEVARLTANLLLDKRLSKAARSSLWKVYELFRHNPVDLVNPTSELHARLRRALSYWACPVPI